VSDGGVTTQFFTGRLGHVAAIGWSTNLHSSRGVTTKLRAKIAERVQALNARGESTTLQF